MDIFEALFTRRSIRKYTDQAVSDEDLHILLKSAMLAPSACNEQPWEFVVVREAATREVLSKTTPYTGMAAHAPVVIIVAADMNRDKAEGFWQQDCAACIENLMLAARGKNLGSVWCGLYPKKERSDYVRKALGMPETVEALGLICIGHPAQTFHEEDRFITERVHYDKW